jgi:hypothetical protein
MINLFTLRRNITNIRKIYYVTDVKYYLLHMLFVTYVVCYLSHFIVTGDSCCFVIYSIFWQLSYSTDAGNILNIMLWLFPNLWYLLPVYDIWKINEMNMNINMNMNSSGELSVFLPLDEWLQTCGQRNARVFERRRE